MESEIYTIGYEGLDLRQFLAHLTHYGIDIVADVRILPTSRKKGFSKTALGKFLLNHGIEYKNFQDLGASKTLRTELYRTWNYSRFFNEYRDSIADKAHVLNKLLSIVRDNRKLVLLCYERDPETCHRKIIAEEVQKLGGNGLKTTNIIPL